MLTPEQIKSLDAAVALFASSFGATKPLFALIDPALVDPLTQETDDPFSCAVACADLPRHSLSIHPIPKIKQPYLLELGCVERNERALSALLRRSMEEACGLHDVEDGKRPLSVTAWLIASDSSLASLANALAHRARMLHPSLGLVLFRYWDPRTVIHLPRILGEPLFSDLLAAFRIDTWFCLRPDQTGVPALTTLQAKDVQGARRVQANRLARPWSLDVGKWRALECLHWANTLKPFSGTWTLGASPEHLELERVAERALALGLGTKHDLVAFAHCALTVHPFFDAHPVVREALRGLGRTGAPTFANEVEQWDEDFLTVLRAGHWLATANAPHTASTHLNR